MNKRKDGVEINRNKLLFLYYVGLLKIIVAELVYNIVKIRQ